MSNRLFSRLGVGLFVFSLGVGSASAQRNFGTQSLVLDDGAGHEMLVQAPPGMTGNVTYTLPLVPAGNPAAGFVGTGTEGQTLRWNGVTGAWQASSDIFNKADGKIGIGTTDPQSALHIRATPPTPGDADVNGVGFSVPSQQHHVLVVENMNTNGKGQGIAIVIHNPSNSNPLTDGQSNNNNSNYLTFYNDNGDKNHIKGRVEGFSYQNYLDLAEAVYGIVSPGDLLNPLNYVSFNLGFDPNFITFDPNFINFTPPEFPSISIDGISGGSFGSLSFSNPFPSISTPITGLDNPFSINTGFIDGIASQLRALPYKNQAIEMITNPVAAAVKFGVSFLGGITYESGSGDYAEWLERENPSEKIGIADVVAVNGGKITKNTDGASQLMVTSWKPAVLGNMPEPGKEDLYAKVAFMGQVPVRITGNVSKGDYIIPSGLNDGTARAVAPENMTADLLDKVLGVSWQDDYSFGPKVVKIGVGLKPHEMVKVIKDQTTEIETLEAQIRELDKIKSDLAKVKRQMGIQTSAK